MLLDEVKDAKRTIEQQLGPQNRNLQERILTLERNNDTISVLYQQQVNENSQLKINQNMIESSMQRKDEKLAVLMKKNQLLKEKTTLLTENMKILREQFVKVQQKAAEEKLNQPSSMQYQQTLNKGARITIRGGTAKKQINEQLRGPIQFDATEFTSGESQLGKK